MDQLNVHKTKEVVQRYAELDIVKIENIGYSPEYNPIEAVFSQVKRKYCAKRLNCLVNDLEFDSNREIKKALQVITPELVQACVRKSMGMLKDF